MRRIIKLNYWTVTTTLTFTYLSTSKKTIVKFKRSKGTSSPKYTRLPVIWKESKSNSIRTAPTPPPTPPIYLLTSLFSTWSFEEQVEHVIVFRLLRTNTFRAWRLSPHFGQTTNTSASKSSESNSYLSVESNSACTFAQKESHDAVPDLLHKHRNRDGTDGACVDVKSTIQEAMQKSTCRKALQQPLTVKTQQQQKKKKGKVKCSTKTREQ